MRENFEKHVYLFPIEILLVLKTTVDQFAEPRPRNEGHKQETRCGKFQISNVRKSFVIYRWKCPVKIRFLMEMVISCSNC